MSAETVAQSRVDALIASLRSGAIGRTEILQIPPRVLTRTRVTPEMLERSFHYKFIIGDLRGSPYSSDLVAAVASTTAQPVSDMGDLRWAIVFFDTNNQRIASLYFDGPGQRGAVDSIAVSFKGGLTKWLSDNFSKAFK